MTAAIAVDNAEAIALCWRFAMKACCVTATPRGKRVLPDENCR